MKKKPGRFSPYTQAMEIAAATQPKVRVNDQGLLEGINKDGSIAWVQDPASTPISEGMRAGHRLQDKRMLFKAEDGTEIRLSYSPDLLRAKAKVWPYLEEMGLEICRRISEGDTLKKICSESGYPPAYIVFKWQIEIPGFRALLAEARKLRAEMFHDEIVEVKDNVVEETSKSSKVKLEALKHLAAVGDPDTYGSKTKISGDANAPLSFIFNTGITRAPKTIEENPAIPAEGGTVDDGSSEDD